MDGTWQVLITHFILGHMSRSAWVCTLLSASALVIIIININIIIITIAKPAGLKANKGCKLELSND